jgi:hypothetical protein
MTIYLYLLAFILFSHSGETAQPFFPPQIVFSPDNSRTIIAIDEVNQQAYKTLSYGSTGQETTFAMKHIPFAVPDSPQSQYYIQLLIDSSPLGCMYGTYWRYGGNIFNSFPSHWLNGTSFEIKNYVKFNYEMIHSNNSTDDEDYWYANTTCRIYTGQTYPCEEIYFKKNTEIPLRSTRVVRQGWDVVQQRRNYKIISMGKPDEKYFDSVPKNWSVACRDVMLGLLYYPQSTKIDLDQSVKIQVWLITPPHRINGNDTLIIGWKPSEFFTWTPTQLSFNSENFQERQILTITRVKNGPETKLIPIFYGGGFDLVTPSIYPIYILNILF